MKTEERSKKKYSITLLLIGFVITCGCCFQYANLYQKEGKREMQHTVELYAARTENLLNSLFHKTDVLESIIITDQGEVPQQTFNDLAKSLMVGKGIRAIQYLPDGVVKYCYPVEGNEKAIGNNIFDNPERKADALLAKNTKEIALSGPYNLTQGGFGLVARNPIFLTQEDGTEKFWGFSVVVLDLPVALDSLMLDEVLRSGYEYCLYTNVDHKKVTIMQSDHFTQEKSIQGQISVPNHTWKLELSHKNQNTYYRNLIAIIVSGCGITLLCALIVHMLSDRNEQLKNYAEVDSLTGLVNRRKFLNYMELRCRDTKVSMAVLFLDIDRFKVINDTYGHRQGDILLKAAAGRMKRIIKQEDVVARMGGDEFIIALEHIERKEDCQKKIKEITEVLHKPMKLDDVVVEINVSIGYAMYPEESNDLQELIDLADKRMYEIKKENEQQQNNSSV